MTITALSQNPLLGFHVALTDPHQPEIAAILRSRGARVTAVPLVQVVPAPSNTRLRTALRRCISHPADYVFMEDATSWHRLCEVARAWHLLPALIAGLDAATIVVGDPVVAASMRADGIGRVREFPTGADGAAGWLLDRNLANGRVMVVRHDAAHSRLVTSLRARRIKTTVVQTLQHGPASEPATVRRLVGMVIRREVHAAVFGSVLPLDMLVSMAGRMGRRDELLLAFATDVVAVCGSAAGAGPVRRADIRAVWTADSRPADVAERLSVELLGLRREFGADGRGFVIQGNVLVTEERSTLLAPGPAAVLRALAGHPGATLSRSAITRLAGSRLSGVDLAVRRLRTALGEHHRLVSAVPRQGYRLDI